MKEPASESYRDCERIVGRLCRAGHEAVLAGGCVRDLLLGREPKDYDIATSARPDDVERLFAHTRSVGKAFGVVLVVVNGTPYEVATFRSDSTYSDGRHPDSVHFTDLREDAARRDFTINGMFWDPIQRRLLDLVGGEEDLRAGLVRAIGEPVRRFREDHLRLIRAVRFAARFAFAIEPRTERTIRDCAHLVTTLAPERLQQELRTILTDERPAAALRLMDQLDLLMRIFPELDDTKGCEQPKNYHPEGDVFVHTILTVEKLGAHPDFELALAALLHDIGKPAASRASEPLRFPEHSRIGRDMARCVCSRLRLSNAETERICWLVKRHMCFKDARKMKESTLKKLFAEPGFDHLAELCRVDALASWGNLEDYEYVMARRSAMTPETIEPPRLMNGNDLIERGYTPSPLFSDILNAVRDRQLEGEITTREEALEMAERLARQAAADRQ